MSKRINFDRMPIGIYFLPDNRSEDVIRDISDCGIDMAYFYKYEKETFDLFEKYGMGIILSRFIPSWVGEFGDRAGKMPELNPFHLYGEKAAEFVDHPAIWAIEIADEPSALDFDYCNKITRFVKDKFPNQFPYLNIYPNYASVIQNNAEQTRNQLGTATYEEHVDKYCEKIDLDYIMYDFYPYPKNIGGFYENLRVVANSCRKTGRALWLIMQAVMNTKFGPMGVNRYRFQAYSSMAFGNEMIIWASYTPTWWDNGVVENDGTKTPAYYNLKVINEEIRTISEEYMRFRNVNTFFVGFGEDHNDLKKVKEYTPIDEINTGVFNGVKSDNGAPLVIGQMVSRKDDDSVALMVFAADDPFDCNNQSYNIVFEVTAGRQVSAIGGKGRIKITKLEDGRYAVPVSSNEGVLIVAK